MKTKLLPVLLPLFFILFFLGCTTNDDYEYSGNLVITGATTSSDINIHVFDKNAIFMTLSNGIRKAELIPGYYTLVVFENNQSARVNFQIIAGKTTTITYTTTGNKLTVEYN